MCPTVDQPLPRDPSPLRLLPESAPAGGSLPQWLTSFVGREREIAAVLALIERDDIHLLTLTGTGGVGKTRLAVRVAEMTDAFPEGTWFVPLAAIRDPALVVPTIANGLGVPAGPSNAASVELARFIGTGRCLLLLDNLEQVVHAAVNIADILRDCPNLKIVVTSRLPLDISGEHIYLVPPLPLPPVTPATNLDLVAANESVALFVKRSQARSAGFTLTAGNAGTIVEICRRLDGLPLAIELAASRVSTVPVPVLLERLDHRLAILTGGPRDAPERLRTMGNAIAWSHDLLDDTEQTLFRRLGVFANGFTLEAAEDIVGFDLDLIDTLDALLANNLVSVRTTTSGEPRYLLLETIREFAADRLAASDEDAAIRCRHAHWYMRLAEVAIPHYDRPEAWPWVRRVEAEIDNCRAALAWCATNDNAETGIRLAGALWRIWGVHLNHPWKDQLSEGRMWLECFLPAHENVPLPHLVEALHGMSFFCQCLDDIAGAQAWAEELLSRSEVEDFPYGIRWASTTLCQVALANGNVDLARLWAERAVAESPRIRDPENHTGIALSDLASLEAGAGNRAAAIAHWQEALGLFRSCGNEFKLADTIIAIGSNSAFKLADGAVLRGSNKDRWNAGDLDGALEHLAEAITICASNGDEGHLDSALYYVANIALEVDQPIIAARLLVAAPPHHERSPEFNREFQETCGRIEQEAGKEVFDQAWRDSRRMSWDDVDAEVAHLHALVKERAATISGFDVEHRFGLTPRELDVERLLADGRSNRQIGNALSLSERTVENHVLHILTKLDLDSRTAAAGWAIRHGLA